MRILMAKILLIDDNPKIQALFSQLLAGMGHEIIRASNGKQGLQLIDESRPDLVITDIMMPEVDGLELLMHLRNTHDSVPVIAISGGMRALPVNFLEQARLFGARYVFEKPVPLDVLRNAVTELLEDASEDRD
jgi:CheY-like chemotaxis protein